MVTIREELLDDFISLAEAHLGAVHLVLWLVRPRTNKLFLEHVLTHVDTMHILAFL